MAVIQRPGVDHDPVKPYNWATIAGQTDPVEILSYPFPATCGHCIGSGEQLLFPGTTGTCVHCGGTGNREDDQRVMVRMKPGDPTTLKEVPLGAIGAFAPDRHEWFTRERVHYSDDPNVWIWKDELPAATDQTTTQCPCGTTFTEGEGFSQDGIEYCGSDCPSFDPNGCAECARSRGPHYTGPCEH
jgi:hypothetical protein